MQQTHLSHSYSGPTGKQRLFSVSSDPFPICPVGLFESPVVGNVFALGHAPVDVQSDVVQLVGRVLVDNALGAMPEGLHCCIIPPLFQVPVFIELPAFVVEPVRDFVTDNHADPAVLRKSMELVIQLTC